MNRRVGIALLGTGTVGCGVADLLVANGSTIAARTGLELQVVSACARNLERARQRLGKSVPVTDDWHAAINHPDCDIVVEVIGGEDTAFAIAQASITAGKPLVTANKALLANRGEQLFATARQDGGTILFEAAVAGCIPAIRVLRHALAGDRIKSVSGIVNGTCNYILTRMRNTGMEFTEALAEASKLGYAEADPTLDIDGWDAAHKTVIMAWLAFGTPLTMAGMPVSGVRDADPVDEGFARMFNHTIKLVATVREQAAGIEASVGMALVANSSKLANVDDNLNAILIDAHACGELLLVGAGAGAAPTAAAIVSDIIEVASGNATLPRPGNGKALLPAGELCRESYLRVQVNDTQGVMAKISGQLADANISIEAIHQEEAKPDEPINIAMLLHETTWQQVTAATASLAEQVDIITPPVLLPVAIPQAK